MIDYRSGLWNDWYGQRGNTPPVMSGDLVEILTHDHMEKNREASVMYGHSLEFDWIDDPSDIVKFRVIKKAGEV